MPLSRIGVCDLRLHTPTHPCRWSNCCITLSTITVSLTSSTCSIVVSREASQFLAKAVKWHLFICHLQSSPMSIHSGWSTCLMSGWILINLNALCVINNVFGSGFVGQVGAIGFRAGNLFCSGGCVLSVGSWWMYTHIGLPASSFSTSTLSLTPSLSISILRNVETLRCISSPVYLQSHTAHLDNVGMMNV